MNEGRMEMVEVMTIHRGQFRLVSILDYEKISKEIAFEEVRFNSLGISSILF
jgi:hypothetical protein